MARPSTALPSCHSFFYLISVIAFNGRLAVLAASFFERKGTSIIMIPVSSMNPSDRRLEMLYVFISNGSAAIIRNWVLNDMQEPPKEVAEFILQATNFGSSSFAG